MRLIVWVLIIVIAPSLVHAQGGDFEVASGASTGGFTYTSRGALQYHGRPFSPAVNANPGDVSRFKISRSPSSPLVAAIAIDGDGQNRLFLLDTQTLVSREIPCTAQRALWSPSQRFMVVHCSYEGDSFVSVDLRTRRVLTGNFLGWQPAVLGPNDRSALFGTKRWQPTSEPRWVGSTDVLTLTVDEYCIPGNSRACTDQAANTRTASYEVRLDAATLALRASPAIREPRGESERASPAAAGQMRIIYVNGILTGADAAAVEMTQLERIVREAGLRDAIVQRYYNQSGTYQPFTTNSCGGAVGRMVLSGPLRGWGDLRRSCGVGGAEDAAEATRQFLDVLHVIPPQASADAERLGARIAREIDAGNPVILVLHSQGNLIGQQALRELSPSQLRRVGVVSLAAPTSEGWLVPRDQVVGIVVEGDLILQLGTNHYRPLSTQLSRDAATDIAQSRGTDRLAVQLVWGRFLHSLDRAYFMEAREQIQTSLAALDQRLSGTQVTTERPSGGLGGLIDRTVNTLVNGASRPIGLGETVSGSLDRGDPKLSDNSYYDQYAYRGRPGERVVVTLRSREFDAFLAAGELRNGAMSNAVTDDDGGGGTDARIEVVVGSSGVFSIRANSLRAGATGAYELSLQAAAEAPPPTVTVAPPAAPPQRAAHAEPRLEARMAAFARAVRTKDQASLLTFFSVTRPWRLHETYMGPDEEPDGVSDISVARMQRAFRQREDVYNVFLGSGTGLAGSVKWSASQGHLWRYIGGGRFVPHLDGDDLGDLQTFPYVQWRQEGGRWVIDEIGDAVH